MGELRWLSIEPWDTLAVRDGRSFDAGSDARADAVLPSPSTVGGAVAQAFGREPVNLVGPFLGRAELTGAHSLRFATPATLVAHREHGLGVLRPDTATVGSSDLPTALLRSVLPGKTEPAGGYVTARELERLLHDRTPDTDLADSVAPVPEEGLLSRETHVGLGLQNGQARDGYLYAAQHLRPAGPPERVGWLIGLAWGRDAAPDAPARTSLPVGGRGRWADLHPAELVTDPLPSLPEDFPHGRVALYCATPACWPDGWRPPLPDGARLVSAAVERLPVATRASRDAADAGRSLLWCARPGSVYHVQFDAPAAAAAWARTYHGRSLLADHPDPAHRRRGTAGFAVVFMGRWRPVQEEQ